MNWTAAPWPRTRDALVAVQTHLAADARMALATSPWTYESSFSIGGCHVASAGDRAWAAAVVWRPRPQRGERRRVDDWLRGSGPGGPRRARDVDDQALVSGRVAVPYESGLLALRHGPILAAAAGALRTRPDVLLVDATGHDHPRQAGLAIHLGAVLDIATVGVTHRPLLAYGDMPARSRGAWSDVTVAGEVVGRWVCTRTGARPVLAHSAWRTDVAAAADVVLAASTEGARTPVPLQEARRVAREARALSTGQNVR